MQMYGPRVQTPVAWAKCGSDGRIGYVGTYRLGAGAIFDDHGVAIAVVVAMCGFRGRLYRSTAAPQ
ncbi:hypothetical protein BDV96DRAFT_567791 [Lophiotrema nucula]|uniref:Uncharacterized protein n=1 Tax=Lophiotrema nucula TaxID=690887 RepID=A0A6A5ZL09_9PLEO|nr:hypothetical protein BDV96DRAFT_567791 [Lophiotrema nucula]